MRVLVTVLALVGASLAYDAVLFSDSQPISSDSPSVSELIAKATSESPLVFLVQPDFTLAQFSKQASVYSQKSVSGLAATVKSAKNHAARHIAQTVEVPSASVVTAESEFAAGQSVYIVAGEEWSSLEQLAEKVLSQLESYTAVLASTDAVQKHHRVKRVATDEMDELESDSASASNEIMVMAAELKKTVVSRVRPAAPQQGKSSSSSQPVAAGNPADFPITIPPFNRTDLPDNAAATQNSSCMFYMEGLTFIVNNPEGKTLKFLAAPVNTTGSGNKWVYSHDDYNCPNTTTGNYTFNIKVDLSAAPATGIKDKTTEYTISAANFQLTFESRLGYWGLRSMMLNEELKVDSKGNFVSSFTIPANQEPTTVKYMGINSVHNYAFGCSDTQAAWFKAEAKNPKSAAVGISLHNVQVAVYGITADKTGKFYFGRQVNDCVGTFSPGSWMGIVTSLVLTAVFIFGFLMLNSVQTMDRFDDPKQKQILINVRE